MFIEVIKEVFVGLWGVSYMPEAIIVAIIMTSVQKIKDIQFIKTYGLEKLAPWLATVLAVILSVFNAVLLGEPIEQAIAPGIVLGVFTSGLYSTGKAFFKKTEEAKG